MTVRDFEPPADFDTMDFFDEDILQGASQKNCIRIQKKHSG